MALDASEVKIVTFYSYKGGVGRSMALANAAAQLANKHGLRVIVIDWDLEAPGLHYYFGLTDRELTKRKGLLDYLEDFKNEVSKGEAGRPPDLTQYFVAPARKTARRLKFGSIRLLTSGKLDRAYAKRVREFPWEEFYEYYSGFRIIETMKKSLRDEADIILVDARSGQSESGATPTVQMPDAVILLFTSNRQSLEGTAKIARFLKNHPLRVGQEFSELRLLFVPSRVFAIAQRYKQWIQNEATPIYCELLAQGIADQRDQPRGLCQCVLVIDPAATVGESLIVLEPERMQSPLRTAYEDLATAIDDFRAGRSLWSTPAKHDQEVTGFPGSAEEEHKEALLHLEWRQVPDAQYSELAEATRRGDQHQIARLNYQLGIGELRKLDFSKAEELLTQALNYYDRENEPFAIIVTIWLARVFQDKGAPTDAWNLLAPALPRAEKLRDPRLARDVRMELAAIRKAEQKYEEAVHLIEPLLRDAEKTVDLSEQSALLHTLGHLQEEQGRLAEAADFFERSLALAERVHDVHRQVENYFCLGNLRRTDNKVAAAAELYQAALALLEETAENRVIRTKLSLALGEIREDADDFEGAKNVYEQVLLDAERRSDVAGKVESLRHLARIERRQGRLEGAYNRYQEIVAIGEGGSMQCGPLHSMAHIRHSQGKDDESELLFQRSLAIAENVGDIRWQIENLICLADLLKSQAEARKAEDLYRKALDLATAADDKGHEGIIRGKLSRLQREE